MRARLNDHYLEIALHGAIAEKNTNEALKVIKSILEYEGHGRIPSLAHTDDNNVNFLVFALALGLPVVVKALLDTGVFNDNAEILFRTNAKGQTLICQAAAFGSTHIVEQLHKISSDYVSALPLDEQKDSRGYKIWLRSDLEGNTPLHYAVINKIPSLYTLLIRLIASETNAINLINQKNKMGNTPLHLALMADGEPHVNLIHALLDAGASLDCANHERITPFGLLCQREIYQQVIFLRRLDDRLISRDEIKEKKHQRIFKPHDKNTDMLLQYYKDYLAVHWEDEKIRKVYFSYMSQQGLANVAIATLELHPDVAPQSDFWAGESKKSISSEVIDDPELAKRLPLYSAKLVASKGIFAFSDHQSVRRERVLAQDKGDLERLIRQIDSATEEWSARKPPSAYKIMTALVPTLGWLAYGAVEAYFIYSAVTVGSQTPTTFTYHGEPILGPDVRKHPTSDHFECHREKGFWGATEYNVYRHLYFDFGHITVFYGQCETNLDAQHSLYKWLSLGVGLAGALANAGLTATMRRFFWDKEVILTIPEKEWRDIRHSLQALIDKLYRHTDGNLPTVVQNIRALEAELARLNGSLSQQETIAIFTVISTTLSSIRADLNVYRRPISGQQQDMDGVVIGIERHVGFSKDVDQEAIPLLDDIEQLDIEGGSSRSISL